MSELRNRTINGLSWSTIGNLTAQVVNFTIKVILARLLSPKEFGLVGMITVFTGFGALLSELGLGAAIIHKQDITQRLLSSIFWVEVGIGIILTLVTALASPLVARFYHQPILQPMTLLISLNFFISSLNGVQRALFNKDLKFRLLAEIEVVSILIAGTVGIVLALAGYSAWSLAWQMIILTVGGVIGMVITCPWHPSFQFDISAIKEVSGFGFNLLGFNIFNYVSSNIDYLLIGRYIGSFDLGLYTKAFNLMLLPLSQISAVVSRVMFPVFSSINNDKTKVKHIFLKTISSIALVTFPLMLGMLAVTRPFILTLFGPQWEGVVPVLQVFCIVGLTHSIGNMTGCIYLSQGRTDWMFWWGVYSGIIKVLGIILGLRWGILGVAAGYTTFTILFLLYPGYIIVGKLIDMSIGEIIGALDGILGCAAIMAIAVWAFGLILPSTWPSWAQLITQVLFGIGVYLIIIHMVGIQAYHDMKKLLFEQWGLVRSKMTQAAA